MAFPYSAITPMTKMCVTKTSKTRRAELRRHCGDIHEIIEFKELTLAQNEKVRKVL